MPYEPGTVPYEGSLTNVIDVDTGKPGFTVYDNGFPVVAAAYTKTTDENLGLNLYPYDFTEYSEIDYELGGEPGAVNRNAYVDNGIPSFDAHDFRGDRVTIPVQYPYGNYGDVGNTDDYASQYALGLAANAYPDFTAAESQDAVSRGF